MSGAPVAKTLVAMLRERAALQPDAVAYTYLGDDGSVRGALTYGSLDEQARAVAARLQGLGAAGSFVPLLYPPGLDFLRGFFGCLYAGARAVPLPVPRHARYVEQLARIAVDVAARCVLSTEAVRAKLADAASPEEGEPLIWIAGEESDPELADAWREPASAEDDIAYLQYTSGSTSDRRGVVITHRNVVANLLAIDRGFRHEPDSVVVSWLPHFHDLGLVAGLLDPLFHGCHAVLLSPTSFVRQPVRWLEAISRYAGTHASSPNFGYDHCVRKVSDAHLEDLDLSSWRVALNGAEPVRSATLEAFAERFAKAGFEASAFYPAYGLAEATLVVTGGLPDAPVRVMHLGRAALERDEVRAPDGVQDAVPLVGCGQALEATEVLIVDPEARADVGAGRVGEIWVSGPGVSSGYWADEPATRETFVPGPDGFPGTFLRTGDLGFLDDGELFITGRRKDVVIIRGSNHYPQDIEWTIEQADPAFRAGCGSAFSVEIDGEERLVVAFELERGSLRSADAAALVTAARRAVAEAHDVHLHELVLLRTGSVPRTSSGKIQRGRCRRLFLEGGLKVVGEGRSATRVPETPSDAPPRPGADPVVTANPRIESERTEPERPETAQPASPAHAGASSLNAWLRDFAGARLNSQLADSRRSIAPHVLLELGNAGVLGLQTPRGLGGLGLGEREAMGVIEQLGAIDLTLAMMVIVHNTLGIRPILGHASPALRDELVPRLASGRELAAFAITERGAGSNPMAIAGTATPLEAGRWRLDAEKIWSGTAGWSSVVNVFVQNLRGDGAAWGATGFAVPRTARGLEVGAEALTMEMRAMVQNVVTLEGVAVDEKRLLGVPGQGMDVAHDAMMHGRLCIAAACVGGMKRALSLMHRYASRRRVSTGLLADNPVLRDRMASLLGAASAIAALVDRVAELLDRGAPVPVEAYVACKTSAPEWLWRAADDLVQFLGGRGYVESNVAPQLLRDARVARILEGPTETLNMFMGSRIANDPEHFHELVGVTLRAPGVSERVREVVAQILDRASGLAADAPARADAARWAHALCGEVGTSAVLLAAAEDIRDDWPAVVHARAWARGALDAAVSRTLSVARDGRVPLASAALADLVEALSANVGDVTQRAAGEDHALDPLLRSHAGPAPTPPLRRELSRGASVHTTPTAAAPTAAAPAAPPPAPPEAAPPGQEGRAHDAQSVLAFVLEWLARELKMPREAINPDGTFLDCGVDSVTSVMLVVSLEEEFGLELPAELTTDVPVIRELARRLADGDY